VLSLNPFRWGNLYPVEKTILPCCAIKSVKKIAKSNFITIIYFSINCLPDSISADEKVLKRHNVTECWFF
jgi:hypothetical protein